MRGCCNPAGDSSTRGSRAGYCPGNGSSGRGADDRTVWVADSFEGLPAPDPAKYPADEGWYLNAYPQLAVSLENVRTNFARYGLLDDHVRFLKGWFKDTLKDAPIRQLAVLRIDAGGMVAVRHNRWRRGHLGSPVHVGDTVRVLGNFEIHTATFPAKSASTTARCRPSGTLMPHWAAALLSLCQR